MSTSASSSEASADSTTVKLKGISPVSSIPNSSSLRIGIVHTQWNKEIISALVNGAIHELERQGVPQTSIHVLSVPGAYELPFSARAMIASTLVDAVLCIGCLIKGETMHFEYINEAVTQGIMKLNMESRVPVIFGVLAVLNEEQAKARAGIGANSHNHGIEWAQSALQMANINVQHLHGGQKIPSLSP